MANRRKPRVVSADTIRRREELVYQAQYRKDRRVLERRYGLAEGEYAAMLVRQGGACVTCNTPEREAQGRRLHIDHCHKTGKVRGLLCSGCNTALGMIRDNPQTLRHLAVYVEFHTRKHEATNVPTDSPL